VSGKYRVERLLGMGGMGVVVQATHLELDRNVALKFLLDEAGALPHVAARFAREARAAARIQSEHVARVLDVGTLENGAPYIVMEYLEGEDLQRLMERRGRLPIVEAVDYLLEACEAVAEAHSLGIVHRDLKPANLFLSRLPSGERLVKVLDFGISRLQVSAEDPRLTSTAAVFGSPLYMSPEQMASAASVDERSDVWSLGVSLYELLTGCHAFAGETKGALIAAVLSETPKPPSLYRPELPRELDRAILRCLEKEPALRFANVAGLAAALSPFGSARSADSLDRISNVLGVRAPVLPSETGPSTPLAPARPTRTDGSWSQTSSSAAEPRRRPPRIAWLAGGAVVAAAAYAVGALRSASPAGVDAPPARASAPPPRATAANGSGSAAPLDAPAATPAPLASEPPTSPRAPLPAKPRPLAPPAACAQLLERQSLGDPLTSDEARTVRTRCQLR